MTQNADCANALNARLARRFDLVRAWRDQGWNYRAPRAWVEVVEVLG